MANLTVYDFNKNKVASMEVSDFVLAAPLRADLVSSVVRAQIAWRYEHRTANSKTRTEVVASGRKIYKQKGTGQARHGDIKAPIFVGGGKAHGPRPRIVKHKVNKKVMKAALRSVLSSQHRDERLLVFDKLELNEVGTKKCVAWLEQLGIECALVVNNGKDASEKLFNNSIKNIKRVKVLRPEGINVFDLMKYKNLLISQAAVQQLVERLNHA